MKNMKNMNDTIRIMTAAAALFAHAAHAQSWTYSPSPTPRISHPDTWVFEVSANGADLTVTNCLAAPMAPGVLPFVDPVGGGYRIVGITGAAREGGVLGEWHERAGALTLPDTLTDIGEYAFCGCLSLAGTLVIPPGVTSIGDRAFYDTGLAGITTPSSGVTFGGGAFAGNPFLDTVYYTGGYPASAEEDLYEGSEGVTSYVLPANASDWDPHVDDGPIAEGLATWLGQPISSRISWTFSDPTLSAPRITHPLGWVFAVTVNGADLTVTNCLASPPIPGPGPLPFADPVGDGSYRIVGIPGTDGTDGVLGAHALKVDFLTLPDTLTAIGRYAFYSCTALKGDLTIPGAVTAIGDMAFANTRLSEIVVPSTGLSLGDAAFAYNPLLTTVLYTGAYPDFVGTDLYLNSFSSVVSFIMSSHEASWTPHVTSPPISGGGAAWQGRTIALYGWGFADSPPRIIHPLGWVFAVTVSGDFLTVTDCLAAPATPGPLPFADPISKGYRIEDITSPTPSREGGVLGDFHVMATSLTLPQAEISAFAFYACTNLTGTLSIPPDWKTINIQTFFRCNKLDTLVFEEPSSMQIIGDDAFGNCSRLSGKLFLPDTVYSIGVGAFGSTGFTEISTPSSTATFGSNAFYTQDPALNAVCYRGDYPNAVASSLYELNGNVTSYVALAYVNSWNLQVSNGPIQNGNATWRGRPIRLYDWYFETPTVLASPTGWKFQVQDMGAGALWVTNCIATPPSPSPLNFTGTIQDACTIVNVGNNGTVAGAGALFNVTRRPYLTHLTLAATTTNIGNSAFYFCTNLTGTVTIPNAVKDIGTSAFQNCTAMTGLTFAAPASLQTIGNSAFYACTNLTGTVAIPNTVRDIGNSAFYSAAMTGLTLGALGGALTSIGVSAFGSCTNLTGNLTLPDAVRNIGDNAFYNTRLTEISTPSTGVTFGNYAFRTSYPELNAVCYRGGYPDSVNTFLYSGGNVTSYVLRAHAANWDANADGLTGAPIEGGRATWRGRPIRAIAWFYDDGAIYDSTGWRFAVDDLPGNALWVTNCVATPPSLTPLDFTGTIQGDRTIATIGNYGNWSAALFTEPQRYYLSQLTLPNTVTNIGNYAFYFCEYINGTLTIPDSVTDIGNYAFAFCTSLTGTLTIPDSVTRIRQAAFRCCKSMSGLNLGGAVENIDTMAFHYWVNFTGTLSIPDSVKTIGLAAFRYGAMSGLTLGNSVTHIDTSAFEWCDRLTGTLTIPDSVTHIGSGAFYNTRLTEISTPSTGVSFGTVVFGRNPLLEAVYYRGGYIIPGTAVEIYGGNLGQSTNVISYVTLEHVDSWNYSGLVSNPPIQNGNAMWRGRPIRCLPGWGFEGSGDIIIADNTGWRFVVRDEAGDHTLRVMTCIGTPSLPSPLDFSKTLYGGLTNYTIVTIGLDGSAASSIFNTAQKPFLTQLTLPPTVTTIDNYAFHGCTNLTETVTIPNSVITIGDGAFQDCSRMTGVLTIPNSVITIGDGAFQNCSGMSGLSLGGAVQTIGDSAFASCTNITGTATIPNSVITIGNGAFQNCSRISNLSLGNAVQTIGDSAFAFCTNLPAAQLTIPASVTSIGSLAFSNTRYRSVSTPSTGVTFGNRVFVNNTYLTNVTYSGSYPVAVGVELYTGSPGAVSYIHHPDCETWQDVTGAFDDATAQWQSRPIICLGHPPPLPPEPETYDIFIASIDVNALGHVTLTWERAPVEAALGTGYDYEIGVSTNLMYWELLTPLPTVKPFGATRDATTIPPTDLPPSDRHFFKLRAVK